ncbi:hypothetical protein M422DRAFT_247538 [Sphaerobolus stellatus SS14]|nr:hypothetical protein M422DRAFT_247538 [Sphaerobolus stellatus SS14]
MSIPNAIRDNDDCYFLKEDVDVAAWLSKITADVPHQVFMHQMKAMFGSHLNFESMFSGFSSNSLTPHHQQKWWITNASTPIRVGSQIIKGCKDNSQVSAPLHQSGPAPTKGKKPLTGSSQSKSLAHTSQPAKIRQSSQQQLDADLDDYNQQCEPPLPYTDEPPTSKPDVEMSAPTHVGASGTLPDESAMNIDHELDDLYD